MTPAVTLILNEIAARLGNITTANGYDFTIQKIEIGKLEPFKSGDIPAANIWPTGHSRVVNDYGWEDHTLKVAIDIRDLTRERDFPEVAATLEANAITAVMRSTTAPLVTDEVDDTFGDTITDISLPDSFYHIGKGQSPWVGAIVEAEIKYVSDIGDLFNHRQ